MKQQTSDYFEGILQLRNGTPQILEWIHKRVKSDGKARVAKEKKVTNGFDLYLNDQHYLQNLGRKIKGQFSGILKISKRLHTVDKMTSKHLYRVTVLFKVLPFKRGEQLKVHGSDIQVLTIDENCEVKDMQTGKKSRVSLDVLERAYAEKVGSLE